MRVGEKKFFKKVRIISIKNEKGDLIIDLIEIKKLVR